MKNSEKILKILSSFVENGILTSQDAKKEIFTKLNFKKENILEKLQLVSREEFEVLKKIVQNLEKKVRVLNKKKSKKAKKP